MNILLTPPETHFDKGLGISAWRFRDSANLLLESNSPNDLLSPISYLQRHSIELYLKSLIYILHKKYDIPFGENFSLERPAILVGTKWISLTNTHNLADLYNYFLNVYNACLNSLPSGVNWQISNNLKNKINLVSGYDPKSTYFRYPESGDKSQDQKKSTIKKIDADNAFSKLYSDNGNPMKCTVMYDSEDNIVAVYDLFPESITNVRKALIEIVEELNNLHCAILGKLTNFT